MQFLLVLMGFLWNCYGIFMGWDVYDISLEFLCDFYSMAVI